MTPQRAAAWAAEAGLIETQARISQAEQTELARADARFHACLDAEYGPDEHQWPGSARHAYQSTVAAIHQSYQREAA